MNIKDLIYKFLEIDNFINLNFSDELNENNNSTKAFLTKKLKNINLPNLDKHILNFCFKNFENHIPFILSGIFWELRNCLIHGASFEKVISFFSYIFLLTYESNNNSQKKYIEINMKIKNIIQKVNEEIDEEIDEEIENRSFETFNDNEYFSTFYGDVNCEFISIIESVDEINKINYFFSLILKTNQIKLQKDSVEIIEKMIYYVEGFFNINLFKLIEYILYFLIDMLEL